MDTESSTAIACTDERANFDQTSETRVEDASEFLLNQSASTENKRPSDTERSKRTASAQCIVQNENFNEQGNIEDLNRSLSNSNTMSNLSSNCISQDKNNVIDTGGDYGLQSSIENNSDLICIEKVNDNNNGSTEKEKETDEPKTNSDVDELLKNFINDSDIIDDSLLDISLGLLNLYFMQFLRTTVAVASSIIESNTHTVYSCSQTLKPREESYSQTAQ